MSKSNKTKRAKQENHRVIALELTPHKGRQRVDSELPSLLDEQPKRKRFLIVCEGETEAAYFEGLCEIWRIKINFDVEILPEQYNQSKYQGSSIFQPKTHH